MKNIHQSVKSFCSHNFTKYLFVGGSTFVIDFLLLLFLYGYLEINLPLSTTIAYWTSIAYNFTLNRSWTFTATEKKALHRNLAFYLALLLFNYFYTLLLVGLLSSVIHFSLAKIITVIIQIPWTYFLYKNYVFGDSKHSKKLKTRLLNWIHVNGKKKSILILALLFVYSTLFFSAFKLYPLDTRNNIDGSWSYAIASLRHHDEQSLGNDIFFTYGPLSTKIISTVHHSDQINDYIVSILLITTVYFLCILLILYSASRLSDSLLMVFIALSALLLVGVPMIDLLFFVTLLIAVLGFNPKNSIANQLILLSGPILISAYKNNLLIAMLVLALFMIVFQDSLKKGVKFIFAFLALYAALLVALGISVTKVYSFLSISILDALDYNEFMSLATNKEYTITFFLTLMFFACIKLVKTHSVTSASLSGWILWKKWLIDLAEIWILWVVFKEASTRSDGHVIVFIPFMFYIAARVIFMLLPRVSIIHSVVIVGIASFSTFVFMVQNVPELSGIPKRIYAKRTIENVTFKEFFKTYDYQQFIKYRQESINSFEGLKKDVSGLRTSLEQSGQYNEDRPIVAYTNTIFYLPAVTDNYRYAPFLQTYQAFPTSMFDKLFIDYLKNNPETLVFWTNINPSVDGRIPTQDLPDTFQYIRQNYDIVAEDAEKGLYLYAKSPQKSHPSQLCTIKHKESFTNTPTPISKDTNEIAVKVHAGSRFALDILYKKPVYKIYLYDDLGRNKIYRTTPSLLEAGLQIDPFLPTLISAPNEDNFEISKFMVSASDQRELKINIEEITCR